MCQVLDLAHNRQLDSDCWFPSKGAGPVASPRLSDTDSLSTTGDDGLDLGNGGLSTSRGETPGLIWWQEAMPSRSATSLQGAEAVRKAQLSSV